MTTAVTIVSTPFTATPGWLMTALQVTILVLVAAGATAVVLTRDPTRQVIFVSIHGVLLAILFMASRPPMLRCPS